MIILALAGLGVLLYGMTLFSRSLETSLGSRFNKKFSAVAKSPIRSYLVGGVMTFITQKTTLVCSMVMGFVEVGTITSRQSIAFILGISFGNALSIILMMFQGFNLTTILTILCLFGAIFTLFFKTEKMQHLGQALAGFGMLFVGIELVGTYATQIFEIPAVFDFLSQLNHPLFVIIIGFVISFLTTSTFASLTVLSALVGVAGAGPISIESAYLGMMAVAIGTALSDYVYTISGQGVEGKRVITFQLLFRVFAFVVMVPLFFTPFVTMLFNALEQNVIMTLIIAHMVQMTIPSLILLPFEKGLANMMTKIVRNKKGKENIYAEFLPSENALAVFGVGYPYLLQSTKKLLVLSEQLQNDLIIRITNKSELRGLSGRIKGLEKVIKVTQNGAIRISAKASEAELPKLNVLLNVLNDLNYLNERSHKLYNYGNDLLKKPKSLTDQQKISLSKIFDEIKNLNQMNVILIDTLIAGQKVGNQSVKEIMNLNKKIFALCQKSKQTIYNDYVKSRRMVEDNLYFSIILAFEDINTDLANISLKLGILSA